MRIALGIEYDGSGFSGWQVQPDRPTVQAEVERALQMFSGTGDPVPTICAGRTDAGVHATAQVVDFSPKVKRPAEAWVRGTNAFLPKSVAVRWAKEVPDDFSARFSARSRTYEYWILNDPVRSPLLFGRSGWCFRPCDEGKMREAAAMLVGTHDFTSFRAAECQAKSPVRTLHSIDVVRKGKLIGIQLHANAFLQHMVRNIVGSLVYVGIGKKPVPWLGNVLEARNRSLAAPTFSASGLYLAGVEYPPELQLPVFSPTFFDGV
ncbi:MAG: tRNA pseudouridine(38-40) synthase TruA [Sutterellaceae bacterium]|nr:tRNA pseudouridine(38-40) synthase TruA [Sutterellaceae bacterium]MDD7441221.1 tRNA pseudouridine(38-40) synthase TruA [Sutterellaceae bacterium]